MSVTALIFNGTKFEPQTAVRYPMPFQGDIAVSQSSLVLAARIGTEDGKELPVGPGRFSVTGRGGKGHALKRKTKIVRVTPAEPLAPPPPPTLLN